MTPKRFNLTSLLTAALLLELTCPALALVSSERVEKLVADAHIISNYQVKAAVSGAEATVSTYRHPNAQDKDCKIDAVLIAKQIISAEAEIKRVRVRLFSVSAPTQYDEIVVGIGDIKAFAAGQLKEEDLLGSLELVKGTADKQTLAPPVSAAEAAAAEAAKVTEGPLRNERGAISARIKRLGEQGVGVKPYEDSFAELEKLAAAGDAAKLTEPMQTLADHIGDAEKRLASAKASKIAQKERSAAAAASAATTAASAAAAPSGSPLSSGALEDDLIAKMMSPEGKTMMMEKMLKVRFGAYMASLSAPLVDQRWSICLRLEEMHQKGYDISKYIPEFQAMEKLAATNQIAAATSKIRALASWLSIPDPFTVPNLKLVNQGRFYKQDKSSHSFGGGFHHRGHHH